MSNNNDYLVWDFTFKELKVLENEIMLDEDNGSFSILYKFKGANILSRANNKFLAVIGDRVTIENVSYIITGFKMKNTVCLFDYGDNIEMDIKALMLIGFAVNGEPMFVIKEKVAE